MKYLFKSLNNIKPLLKNRRLFIFLDYDGTLVPIRPKPGLAVISKRAKNLLRELSKTSGCKLAVISGRSLKDIRRMVGLKNVIYGGNHGLELAGPQVRFKSPVSPKQGDSIKKISRALHSKLRSIEGVLIENKGLSLSVHYRGVSDENIPVVQAIFREATAFNLRRKEIRVRLGKMVLEVCPPVNWDKGKAVLWLMRNISFSENVPVLLMYIGDDVTDEDAFKVLKGSSLTIFVGGPKKSNARYYLKDTHDVLDFLKRIIELRRTPEKPETK